MTSKRIPAIDFFRTIALALMIIYHFIYDLDQWTSVNVDVTAPFWFIIGKTAALLFIFLSGFSSGLSKNPVKNGLRVLFFGMIITLVTYVIFPEQYVRFGILHFLGVMMILYPLLSKLPSIILILASLSAFAIGFYFADHLIPTSLLLPLGLMYPGFSTMDYYPLLPYSGVSILGTISFRYLFIKRKIPTAKLLVIKKQRVASPIFTWISRHSLGIYLIHQPILLALIFAFKAIIT